MTDQYKALIVLFELLLRSKVSFRFAKSMLLLQKEMANLSPEEVKEYEDLWLSLNQEMSN